MTPTINAPTAAYVAATQRIQARSGYRQPLVWALTYEMIDADGNPFKIEAIDVLDFEEFEDVYARFWDSDSSGALDHGPICAVAISDEKIEAVINDIGWMSADASIVCSLFRLFDEGNITARDGSTKAHLIAIFDMSVLGRIAQQTLAPWLTNASN